MLPPGSVGAPPFGPGGASQQLNIDTLGLLTTPAQFGDIVIKRDATGRITRVGDVARVDLGAADYTTDATLGIRDDDGTIEAHNAAAVGVLQLPGANALDTEGAVVSLMKRLSPDFPPGLGYKIIYNPTEYVSASIDEVEKSLGEAIILVVVVIVIFLQTWRAALIPILAIPVSLVGSLAVMKVAGFSLNNLTLFGLVLAIGIVVDDAIVVVEAVEHHIEHGMNPRDATVTSSTTATSFTASAANLWRYSTWSIVTRCSHARPIVWPGKSCWRTAIRAGPAKPWWRCWRWRMSVAAKPNLPRPLPNRWRARRRSTLPRCRLGRWR